ncbi:unnamed protein product [Toxocara canis]|uniref:DUF295 domain-containing protein n=1 Tax=Toxocara canis TaxID=6265 RepID=A0A183UDI0_TOXCA|nr:unnamed protein product [Toxocara canis]
MCKGAGTGAVQFRKSAEGQLRMVEECEHELYFIDPLGERAVASAPRAQRKSALGRTQARVPLPAACVFCAFWLAVLRFESGVFRYRVVFVAVR